MLPDRGHIAYIHHFDHNDETDGVHIGLYVILLEVHGWVGCVPLLLQDSKQVHPLVTRKIDNNGLWFAYQHITKHVMTQEDVKKWSAATTQWRLKGKIVADHGSRSLAGHPRVTKPQACNCNRLSRTVNVSITDPPCHTILRKSHGSNSFVCLAKHQAGAVFDVSFLASHQ